MKKAILITVVSGSGKSTVCKALIANQKSNVAFKRMGAELEAQSGSRLASRRRD